MGNTLDSPNTLKSTSIGSVNNATKETSSSKNGHQENIHFGVSAMQGWRVTMEDEHIYDCDTSPLPNHSLFAVFDGHGGTFAAEYSRKNLARVLYSQEHFIQYMKHQQRINKQQRNKVKNNTKEQREQCQLLESAFQHAFVDLDYEILQAMIANGCDQSLADNIHATDKEEDWDQHVPDIQSAQKSGTFDDAGTTVVAILLTPDFIICANAGDSRAILLHGTTVAPLSCDHSPCLPLEEQRIINAGGIVNCGRVDGVLAMSRALGDFNFKDTDSMQMAKGDETTKLQLALMQKVSPIPDVTVHKRNITMDKFIVMACDGIWDVFTNDECMEHVDTLFAEGESNLGLICEELLDICLKKGSRDNMTAMVLQFPAQTVGQGGGVAKRRKRR